jgi:hypothetical protein
MSSDLFPGRRVLWTPLAVAWAPPSADVAFCCEAMASAVAFDCTQHSDPFECADHLVVYNEVLDEYGLVIHDGGPSYILMAHCPWCGARLPESQRDRWFDETEARGLTDDTLPPDYRTAAWRRSGA